MSEFVRGPGTEEIHAAFITRSSSVEVQVLGGNEQNDQITTNESHEDAKISPAIGELVSEGLVEFIAHLERAVIAHIGSVVENVAWCTAGKEVAHVTTTFLPLGSTELVKFSSGALNSLLVELSHNHTSNETSEWIEFVQPYTPELGNLWLGDRNTTEQSEDNDDERIAVRGDEWCGC